MLSVLVNTFRVLSSPAMIVGGSAGGTTVDDADIDRLPDEKRMGWTVRRRKELMIKDFVTSTTGGASIGSLKCHENMKRHCIKHMVLILFVFMCCRCSIHV